jgi:preprotein translocase subunit SecY
MENPLKNLFAVTDLRNRILFTLALIGVYRVGAHVTTPGVNREAIALVAEQAGNTMFGLYNMFTGGNLLRATVFALGVMPYISASIILQLLTVVWPYLERISKEGELGRRKITQYTRYLTLALAFVQSLGIAFWLEQNTDAGIPLVIDQGWGFRFMAVLTLTTGTMFIMWLGEQITERGIGNGMSLLIFVGIIEGLPSAVFTTLEQVQTAQIGPLRLVFLTMMMVAVIGAIVFVERAHRRITVQYAKRVVGPYSKRTTGSRARSPRAARTYPAASGSVFRSPGRWWPNLPSISLTTVSRPWISRPMPPSAGR